MSISSQLFKSILYIVFFVLFAPLSGFAQDTTLVRERAFDEVEWRRRTEHLNYNETPVIRKKRDFWTPSFAFDLPPMVGILVKIVLILALVGLLILLLWRIAGAQGFIQVGNRKIRAYGSRDITLENIDENVLDAAFEPFIQEALVAKNYTLAIRLYYLWLIKDLSLAKQIFWKKDKTNAEYIRDIESSELSRPFRNLTNIYERTWYGERGVDEAEFKNVETQFKAFLAKLAV